MKKVMCFGTFDLVHLGHLNYFYQAKKYGDYLIVVVARDKTKQKQDKEIVFTENERLELIKNLKIVDETVLGNEENHFKIIEDKKPDVICLGYDHSIEEEDLQDKLLKLRLFPKIVRAKAYHPDKNKTTKIKETILQTK